MHQNPDHRIEHASPQPRSARELISEFEAKERLPQGEFLTFEGVGDKDIYNITAPFEVGSRTYIAGRVQPWHTQIKRDSETRFFIEQDGVWTPAEDAPTFPFEDQFVTKVGNELVFGGVEMYADPAAKYSEGLGYRTVFYRGKTLQSLRRFSQGPDLMKDIRLVELPDGEIGVFTRPQRPAMPEGGRGKIGFTTIPTLDALTAETITGAKIIENQFREDEWGGVNNLAVMENGRIGVVGHIAYSDTSDQGEMRLHYAAMAFEFDPAARTASPPEIIATRKNFPPALSRYSPRLDDIFFPGDFMINKDGTVTLFGGLSDRWAGKIVISSPFTK